MDYIYTRARRDLDDLFVCVSGKVFALATNRTRPYSSRPNSETAGPEPMLRFI